MQQLVPYLVQTGLPSIRDSLYTQESTGYTIRGIPYNLLLPSCSPATTTCEFYDLQTDPTEGTDLLLGTLTAPQAAALNDLKAKLRALRGWSAGPLCP